MGDKSFDLLSPETGGARPLWEPSYGCRKQEGRDVRPPPLPLLNTGMTALELLVPELRTDTANQVEVQGYQVLIISEKVSLNFQPSH